MSQYVLRGTSGPGDEPNDEDPLSHFSIDMRWEIGYDPQWFTFYAALLDEDADDVASPVFEVGAGPCECATVEALNRELDAVNLSLASKLIGRPDQSPKPGPRRRP